MGMTITEKIMARAAGEDSVEAGVSLRVKPDFIVAYDFPGYTDTMFAQMEQEFGIPRVQEPERYLLFADHLNTKKNLYETDVHDVTRAWAESNGVRYYEGEGIGHQLIAELGFAVPGKLLVHFDGHISGVGAFGALGWGVRRDLLEAWVSGQIHLHVPPSVRFHLEGSFGPFVDSRDLVHYIIRSIGADGCVNQVSEYVGPGAREMSIGHRQGLCAMAMFTGSVSSIFEPDEKIDTYLSALPAHEESTPLTSDLDASYSSSHSFDLSDLEPQIVVPGSARSKNTQDVTELVGTPLQHGYIGSCASGRIEDLRQAAEILRDKRVAPGFKLKVIPTSEAIRTQAQKEGLIQILEEAGAYVGPSSCDFCFGYADPLEDGDSCISTGVLNISGRMGSTKANIYMGSAYAVAASAIAGEIRDPREFSTSLGR